MRTFILSLSLSLCPSLSLFRSLYTANRLLRTYYNTTHENILSLSLSLSSCIYIANRLLKIYYNTAHENILLARLLRRVNTHPAPHRNTTHENNNSAECSTRSSEETIEHICLHHCWGTATRTLQHTATQHIRTVSTISSTSTWRASSHKVLEK